MNLSDSKHPNVDQIAFWDGETGQRWVRHQGMLDAILHPFGVRVMERAGLSPGERVLDVGCGCGQTTVEIAQRLEPQGAVTGVDVSSAMLAQALTRAEGMTGADIAFERADAETHAFADGAFDLVFSRFGTMFFANPDAAFSNLRAALAPGGRVGFVCWQKSEDNPWFMVQIGVAERCGLAIELAGPNDPGPFQLAESGRLQALLEGAGFADIVCEGHDQPFIIPVAADLDQAVRFAMEMGPITRVLDGADDAMRSRIGNELTAAFSPHAGSDGVRMDAASWIVTARRS